MPKIVAQWIVGIRRPGIFNGIEARSYRTITYCVHMNLQAHCIIARNPLTQSFVRMI